MSLSIIVIIICSFCIMIGAILPYNKVRLLFYSFLPAFCIVFLLWILDKFVFNYTLSYSIGLSLSILFSFISKYFDTTTRGLATNAYAFFLFLSMSLLTLVFFVIFQKSLVGKPPYIVNSKKIMLHIMYSILLISMFLFLVLLFFSGTRNLFYIKDGFLEVIFEAFVPYQGVLA